MRNDATGNTAATSAIVAVYIDATARKAQLLPADVRQRIARMIEETSPDMTGHEYQVMKPRSSQA